MVNRRDFIKSFFRNTILLLLTAFSGFLIFKEKSDTQVCNLDFVCGNCNKVPSCALNQAIQYKKGIKH